MNSVILTLGFFIVVVSTSPVVVNKDDRLEVIPIGENTLENIEVSNQNEDFPKYPLLKQRMKKSRKLQSSSQVEARKKSKLKKAFLPIAIFILIKAMILLPLAFGILAFKAWNAMQLSFLSFVTAIGLAIWKFCTKINQDDHPTVIHGGWDLDRSDSQFLAYNSHVPY